MNQLVLKNFGSVDNVRRYAGALRSSTRAISVGQDKDILKVDDKTGNWRFGQEDNATDYSDLWAVNPLSVQHGYIAFDNSDIAETVDGDKAEMLFPVTQDLPEYRDLPELYVRSSSKSKARGGGNPVVWKFQMALEMVCVEGPNKGAQVVFKPSSMGGLRCVRLITEEIARRFDAEETEDAEQCVPVVELDSRSYYNKSYGKDIFNPVMHIIEWAGLDDETFTAARQERDEEPKSKGKANGKSGGSKRVADNGEDRRTAAREDRKSERTARGEPVDKRRSAREEPEDDDAVDDSREEPRAQRGRATAEKPAEEPRGRRGARARDEDVEDVEEAPRGRGRARGGDEDDRPARGEARGARGRDAEDDRGAGRRGRRDDDTADEAPRRGRR
jgi:hypothetical protein